MVEEIVWVLNPIEHRKEVRLESEKQYEEKKSSIEKNGGFFFDVLVDTNIPDDLWVCDLCNDQIAVDRKIPVVDNLALCPECFAKWNTKEYINDKTLEGDCPCVSCKTKVEKEEE